MGPYLPYPDTRFHVLSSRGLPPTRIVPLIFPVFFLPASISRNVVLPAPVKKVSYYCILESVLPDGPRIAVICPGKATPAILYNTWRLPMEHEMLSHDRLS